VQAGGSPSSANSPTHPHSLLYAHIHTHTPPHPPPQWQVLGVCKSLCHHARHRCTAVTGGDKLGAQVAALSRPQDVVVCTPGRLLQHVQDNTVYLGDVQYLILDEAVRDCLAPFSTLRGVPSGVAMSVNLSFSPSAPSQIA
jgi:hypothetical protein